eukprot:COSAG02_NODE_7196_length_3125_cov_1.842697_4_plen_81_part_00
MSPLKSQPGYYKFLVESALHLWIKHWYQVRRSVVSDGALRRTVVSPVSMKTLIGAWWTGLVEFQPIIGKLSWQKEIVGTE